VGPKKKLKLSILPEVEALFGAVDVDNTGYATRLDLRQNVQKLIAKCDSASELVARIKGIKGALVEKSVYHSQVQAWLDE